MKPNYFKLFAGIPLILCCLFLSSCKIMKPSDYKKAKEVVSSELAKVGLHGDVAINKLDWTAFETINYRVSYTYSEKTYDGQTVTLETDTVFHNDWTDTTSDHFPEYKEAYLKQQSVQKKEKEIESQLKKQSLGLPINFFGFLSNSNRDEKEQILDSIASPKSQLEGKRTLWLLSNPFSNLNRSRINHYDHLYKGWCIR